jgi:hypothetical protein
MCTFLIFFLGPTFKNWMQLKFEGILYLKYYGVFVILYVYTWRWAPGLKHIVFLIWYIKQMDSLELSMQSLKQPKYNVLSEYRNLD